MISQGTSKTAFTYGPNREVYKRVDTRSGKQTKTLYLGGYEQVKLPSGITEHKFYVGNVVITERSNNANDEFYLHKDHQGSTTSITNASGSLVQQFIYDPWGKQYNVHSNSIFSAYSSPGISRGYTGHKMINDMDIIHMNGRTYDPTLGRFLQADPFVQAPMNSQNYNRYSYVLNNPMSYTDPSGYFFNKLFKKLNKALGKFAPFVGIAMMFIPGAQGFGATLLKGFVAGGIATGSLKGALVGAFSAGVFYGIGNAFSQANCSSCYTTSASGGLTNALTTGARVAKVAAHAIAGGVMSVLNGGKFGHGFAAAGLTQAMAVTIDQIGPEINGVRHSDWYNTANRIKRVVASAVVGGTASSITGGKFANGAVTGAFSRGFNDEAHNQQEQEGFGKFIWNRLLSGQVRDDIFSYFGGMYDGASSVFRGSYRFGYQAAREYDSNIYVQSMTNMESRAMYSAVNLYATNGNARGYANQALVSHVTSSTHNMGYAVGRFVTGTLSGLGFVAIAGDSMHYTHQVGQEVTAQGLSISGILGQ